MKHYIWIFILLLLASCTKVSRQQQSYIDSLYREAYRIRYSDIDSTRQLASKALEVSTNYPDGKARAMNMLSYVDYQQMNYLSALHRLDSIPSTTSNQIILLVGDVLRMKINQRIGNGMAFFESRAQAQKRMKRVEEEASSLDAVDAADYDFARTEYHIISSTYYYYLDQQQEAINEINTIANDFEQVSDTTQWLYYNYMLGSGGLIEGNPDDVTIREFDHLMICWVFSRNLGVTYFEANSLQALASRLASTEDRMLISSQRPDVYHLLLSQHQDWMPVDSLLNDTHLPEALAQHALYTFRQYKDLFQMACAYRTIGELSFQQGYYMQALHNFSMALDCVNEQFITYQGNADSPLLSLYDAEHPDHQGIEISWIDDPDVYTIPEWISGIRQQISLTYSALGMTLESDYNRRIYLDILARSSQNIEMEGRMTQLREESASLRFRLWLVAMLFILLLILIVTFSYRLKKNNEAKLNERINGNEQESDELLKADEQLLEVIQEKTEEVEEAVNLSRLKLTTNKEKNIEKRAKVALVNAVMPFLDRILNEVKRIQRKPQVEADQLDYIVELTDRIVTYNDILTEWIQMEKGELSLQISTVSLNRLFSTLQRGHFAFDQKGVKLIVKDTDLNVKADEALTLFMLNTLADNARKFTPEGGMVTVAAQAFDEYVELSVSDTGCGMSAEDVEMLNNNKVYDSRKIGTHDADAQEVNRNKGFGFGIMNCRGIIEKYRKSSNLFAVCHFGVESEKGKGSRFFFRLPRVLTLLLCFLLSSFLAVAAPTASSASSHVDQLMEKLCHCNDAEDYQQSMDIARQILSQVNPGLCLTQADEDSLQLATNEVALFLQGTECNYQTLIILRNEVAVASLALNQWDVYHYNNRLFTTLYKLYNQDQNLPGYCDKLQKTQTTNRQLLVLLVIFSILVVIFSLVLLRKRMSMGKALVLQRQVCDQLYHVHPNIQLNESGNLYEVTRELLHVAFSGINHWHYIRGIRLILLNETPSDGTETDAVEESQNLFDISEGELSGEPVPVLTDNKRIRILIYQPAPATDANLDALVFSTLCKILQKRVLAIADALNTQDMQTEQLNHLRYEEGRVHVQNQVLDNCLSTIKHESMYYPARIRQLAERIRQHETADTAEDVRQLSELSDYYKELYTLLSAQADKQILQNCYRPMLVSLQEYLVKAERHITRLASRKHIDLAMEVIGNTNVKVHADAVLLDQLFVLFNRTFIDWYAELPAVESKSWQIKLELQQRDGLLYLTYHLLGICITQEQAHSLFYPESRHISLLIAKQIVRELDSMCNFPGLRLVADSTEYGTRIWFTLKSPNS